MFSGESLQIEDFKKLGREKRLLGVFVELLSNGKWCVYFDYLIAFNSEEATTAKLHAKRGKMREYSQLNLIAELCAESDVDNFKVILNNQYSTKIRK